MSREELVKEAEDYANKKVPKAEMPNMWSRFYKSYLAGAEFGYKKGFEFGVKSNEKVNKIVANEWHKGSEHPNHNHEVLCILWGNTKEVGYCEHDIWHFEAFTADDEDVDYWQEIVPPKEIK